MSLLTKRDTRELTKLVRTIRGQFPSQTICFSCIEQEHTILWSPVICIHGLEGYVPLKPLVGGRDAVFEAVEFLNECLGLDKSAVNRIVISTRPREQVN